MSQSNWFLLQHSSRSALMWTWVHPLECLYCYETQVCPASNLVAKGLTSTILSQPGQQNSIHLEYNRILSTDFTLELNAGLVKSNPE
jgi:hypothetical protein